MSEFEELKSLILRGGVGILFFWISIPLAFYFYPDDIDGAAALILYLSIVGTIISIGLVAKRIWTLTK